MNALHKPVGKRGLILVENLCLGYQLSTLLKKKHWQMDVVHQDKQAYALILRGGLDTVITDIETSQLGGLAVLTYCKRHWPSITTYAIARNSGDAYLKKLARDMGGCRGFFYLTDSQLEVDTGIGMAAQLMRQPAMHPAAHARPFPLDMEKPERAGMAHPHG
jgi:CheY-like chemotaxis protein